MIATAQQIDRAGHALLDAIQASVRELPGVANRKRRKFLWLSQRLDQAAIVHAAAARLSAELENVSLDHCEETLWASAGDLFGWADLKTLDPAGSA